MHLLLNSYFVFVGASADDYFSLDQDADDESISDWLMSSPVNRRCALDETQLDGRDY